MVRRQIVDKFPRHTSFAWVAPPIGLYAPAFQYAPARESPPPVITVSPVIYASPIVYVAAAAQSPPAAVAAAPPETSLARVVEHATGRYELRGDGASTPYAWVWVPHPPPPPPEGAQGSEAAEGSARSTGRTPTYQWTDEDGTTFVTNRLEQIPERHRSRALGPSR